MITCYHLIVFCFIFESGEVLYHIGRSYSFFITLLICVNMGYMVFKTLEIARNKAKWKAKR